MRRIRTLPPIVRRLVPVLAVALLAGGAGWGAARTMDAGRAAMPQQSGGQVFSVETLRALSGDADVRYLGFLEQPTMSLGLYVLAAGSTDEQDPHARDEAYLVVSGKASLEIAGSASAVGPGSVAFVRAGVDHRFTDIEEELTVLVFFAGPAGGPDAPAPLAETGQPPIPEMGAEAGPDAAELARDAAWLAEIREEISGREERPAEEVFDNIQALRGVPAGRLLALMDQAFTKSIGVGCEHCHEPILWGQDSKAPKGWARKMWPFMQEVSSGARAIKPSGAVNCYTCHRGRTRPALNAR